MTTPTQTPSDRTGCRRCGTCCQKGGPTLHVADRSLVEQGRLPIRLLYTIRPGEIVHDPVQEKLIFAEADMIKLKGTGDAWTCTLFDAANSRCRQYDDRPVECRAMTCWDTDAIEELYTRDRLTRRDLLAGLEGLWQIIEAHEHRCAYRQLHWLAAELSSDAGAAASDRIMEMLRYDRAVRDLAVESVGTDPEHLDFLFGRPMTHMIGGFGLRLVPREGRTVVVEDPARKPRL